MVVRDLSFPEATSWSTTSTATRIKFRSTETGRARPTTAPIQSHVNPQRSQPTGNYDSPSDTRSYSVHEVSSGSLELLTEERQRARGQSTGLDHDDQELQELVDWLHRHDHQTGNEDRSVDRPHARFQVQTFERRQKRRRLNDNETHDVLRSRRKRSNLSSRTRTTTDTSPAVDRLQRRQAQGCKLIDRSECKVSLTSIILTSVPALSPSFTCTVDQQMSHSSPARDLLRPQPRSQFPTAHWSATACCPVTRLQKQH